MVLKKIRRNVILFSSLSTSWKCRFFTTESYNPFKLLSYHFKSGRVSDAEKLFDQMPHGNIVLWSIAIHGYAINGYHKKSVNSFIQMQRYYLVPNSYSVVGVLVGIAGLRDSRLAGCVHGLIVKNGLELNAIVGTAMLDAYSKCGNVSDSCKVFEGIRDPGLVSCNAILAGFMSNGRYEKGFLFLKKFRGLGLMPNEATVLVLIKGYVALETRMCCESIHCLVVKLGLMSDISVNNSVLDMYSSLLDLSAASRVFDEMECKDVISWTTMMGLLVDLEFGNDALKLFAKLRDSGVKLDTVLLIHLISVFTILGDLRRGRQVHAQVVCRVGWELPLANCIVSMYSKCGDLNSSRTVFDQITERSLVSWTALISGYVQNGLPNEALHLVWQARVQVNYSLDPALLVSVLTACGDLAALEYTQQFHCSALVVGLSYQRSIQNSLISAYSKCGNVGFAYIVFKEMGYLRNVVSWNAIINGYGINGYGETALSFYHEMRKGGEDPDSATFLCVLSACSHAGLLADGLMIFKEMVEDKNIKPSQEQYGCVIDLLARAGCLSDSSGFDGKILEEMGPNVWKALLSGCAHNGNVVLAEVAAEKLSEQGSGDLDHVVLLSNVYASVGRFEDAEKLRLSAQTKGFIKIPGLSFLKEI